MMIDEHSRLVYFQFRNF